MLQNVLCASSAKNEITPLNETEFPIFALCKPDVQARSANVKMLFVSLFSMLHQHLMSDTEFDFNCALSKYNCQQYHLLCKQSHTTHSLRQSMIGIKVPSLSKANDQSEQESTSFVYFVGFSRMVL